MSILTKVLIGLVILATFPVLYYSAGVLNVEDAWNKKVRELEVRLADERQKNELLVDGDLKAQLATYVPGKPEVGAMGLTQVKAARDRMLLSRGRFWYARPVTDTISAESGSLRIELVEYPLTPSLKSYDFDQPSPNNNHGLDDKSFLYIFQMGHNGEPVEGKDKYVGEFVVSGLPPGVNENVIPLKPALPLTKEQWDALKADVQASTGQWVVYDKMPLDTRDVFVGLDAAEIKRYMPSVPETVITEYTDDNQAPTQAVQDNAYLKQFVVTDPKTDTTKFLRPLRNYEQIFTAAEEQLTNLNLRLQIVKRDKEFADQAVVNLEKVALPALEAQRMRLEQEKTLVDADLKVAAGVAQRLQAAVTEAQADVARLVTENKRRLEEAAAKGRLAQAPAADGAAPAEATAAVR